MKEHSWTFPRNISIFLHSINKRMLIPLKAVSQFEKGHRTSALSPLLRVIAIVFTGSIAAMYYIPDTLIRIFFGVIDLVILIYFLWKYEILFNTDKSELHSEDYLTTNKRLELIEKEMAIQGEGHRLISAADKLLNPEGTAENKGEE